MTRPYPDVSSLQGLRHGALIVALLLALWPAATGCVSRRSTPPPPSGAIKVAQPQPSSAARRVDVPKLRPGSFRVCTLSFNSPDELAAIRSHLRPKDFDIIDLTAFPEAAKGTISSAAPAPPTSFAPGWLIDWCRPDLSCDVAVYSGEFAGAFFGKYGIALSIQEMEEASCQPRCQGLFHDPREVFLLGCNTLATKSADNRTPEQYLSILRGHGFSRAEAERVVNLRYGPLGPSFRESVRRIFMGVPRIYGFSSVAPFAEGTVPQLHEYFKRKGDYARYLARVGRDSSPNKELRGSFAETSLVQTTGVTPLEPVAADRALICKLYDDTQTVGDRLRIVRQVFSRSDFLTFVPTVQVFLARHPPEQFGVDERRLLKDIQSLEAPRRQMTELIYQLRVSTLKIQMAHLALQLAWITRDQFNRLAVEGAKQLLAEPLSTEVVDIGCELSKYAPAGTGLRSEEIPEELFRHPEGLRLLDCFLPADPRLSARMVVGLRSIDELTRVWTAYALSRRVPLNDAVLTALAVGLKDPSPRVRDHAQWIFGAQAPLSPQVLAAIRDRNPPLANALEAQTSEGKR